MMHRSRPAAWPRFPSACTRRAAYLQRRGMPSEPEALMEHDALRLLTRSGDAAAWELNRGEAHWEGVPPGRATANAPELLLRLARSGAGIAAVTDHFAAPYVKSGELVPVLETGRCPRWPRGGVPRQAIDAGEDAGVSRCAGGGVFRASVRAGS